MSFENCGYEIEMWSQVFKAFSPLFFFFFRFSSWFFTQDDQLQTYLLSANAFTRILMCLNVFDMGRAFALDFSKAFDKDSMKINVYSIFIKLDSSLLKCPSIKSRHTNCSFNFLFSVWEINDL